MFPDPAGFKKWRVDVTNEIVKAACGGPDKTFEWRVELEEADKGVERFAGCSKKALALGAKLDKAVDVLLVGGTGQRLIPLCV